MSRKSPLEACNPQSPSLPHMAVDDETAGGGVDDVAAADTIHITAPSVVSNLERIHLEVLAEHTYLSSWLARAQAEREPTCAAYKDVPRGKTPFEAFVDYLASPEGDALRALPDEDLALPMSNYFISSSHNTYLTGNQLSSHASADGYKDVLLRGCRCVEIDVWNGKEEDDESSEGEGEKESKGLKARILRKLKAQDEPKADVKAKGADADDSLAGVTLSRRAEPRVLHGYTLTKEVPFREVCESIRDNAFVTSDLPVIVSLEIHTNLQQQEMMVDIIKSTWGDHLVDVADGVNDIEALPSPKDLKRKILIKVKYTAPEKAHAKAKAMASSKPPSSSGRGGKAGDSSSSDDASTSKADGAAQPKPQKRKMLESLSSLGIYTRAYHFKSFDQPEASLPAHVFSLSEGTIVEAHSSTSQALFKHNQNYFMRAYPKGSRISSSNLNPPLFWRHGVQMVALNWQNCDKGIMLNEAMFANSGGYVAKPVAFRSGSGGGSAETGAAKPAAKTVMDLSIEFIAAQDIPLPPGATSDRSFRPYVKCTLHAETLSPGAQSRASSRERGKEEVAGERTEVDTFSKGGKQTTVSGASKLELKGAIEHKHGRSPDFSDQRIAFKRVAVDDEALSFLRFKVEDSVELRRDELVAWACLRLDRVQPGLRLVRLFTAAGRPSAGFLVVRIAKSVDAPPAPPPAGATAAAATTTTTATATAPSHPSLPTR